MSPSWTPLSTTVAGVPATATRLTEEGRDVEVVVEIEIVVATDVEDIVAALDVALRSRGGAACARPRGVPSVWFVEMKSRARSVSSEPRACLAHRRRRTGRSLPR